MGVGDLHQSYARETSDAAPNYKYTNVCLVRIGVIYLIYEASQCNT